MEKWYCATYTVETADPGFSTVYTDSTEFETVEEAMELGERVYGDAFVGIVQVGGNEPF